MSEITRRNVLAAGAALALPVRSDPPVDENPRPVFVPPLREVGSRLGMTYEERYAWSHQRHLGAVWVWEHRDNLPTGYEEIESLPQPVRDAVIDALPTAVVVDLLLARIERMADADSELTEAQRALLAEAPRWVTTEWADADNDAREAMYPDGGFWQRVKVEVSVEEWQRVFGQSDRTAMRGMCRHLGIGDCARAVGW